MFRAFPGSLTKLEYIMSSKPWNTDHIEKEIKYFLNLKRMVHLRAIFCGAFGFYHLGQYLLIVAVSCGVSIDLYGTHPLSNSRYFCLHNHINGRLECILRIWAITCLIMLYSACTVISLHSLDCVHDFLFYLLELNCG